jgi:COMPASS component SWD3
MFAISPTPAMARPIPAGMDNFADQQTRKSDPYVEGNLKVVHITEFPTADVMCVRFSPDGAAIACGLISGVIKVVSSESGQVHHSLTDDETNSWHLPVTCLKFCPAPQDAKVEHKHILMATYASGIIKFWHYTSGSCLYTINETRQTLAAAYDASGKNFFTVGATTDVHMYNLETKQLMASFNASYTRDIMDGHRSRVFAVQGHPHDDNMFITGGWDDTVQFWDTREKKRHAVRKISGPHICGDALDIDPKHNHILTGSWRKHDTLQIWDWDSGRKIKDVPQDQLYGSLLYCAQWLGKDHIICGGCEQSMARVIDRGTLNTVGQLVDLPKGVYHIDHERSGVARPRIAIASANKVYILRLETRK